MSAEHNPAVVRLLSQQQAMIREILMANLIQSIFVRDHGTELGEWTKVATVEAAGMLDGITPYESDMMMSQLAEPNFDLLEELTKLHKEMKSDA